jgi:hypothetical protein
MYKKVLLNNNNSTVPGEFCMHAWSLIDIHVCCSEKTSVKDITILAITIS